jgi:hypothetical protein
MLGLDVEGGIEIETEGGIEIETETETEGGIEIETEGGIEIEIEIDIGQRALRWKVKRGLRMRQRRRESP